MLRRSVVATAGLAVLAGAVSLNSASAADKERKNPLSWLRGRSADARYKSFSNDHDEARARHFQASEQDRQKNTARDGGTLSRVKMMLNLRKAEPMPQTFAEPASPPSAHAFRVPAAVSPTGESIQPVGAKNYIDAGYENTTSDPNKLKRVTSILPYADYSPLEEPQQAVSENLREPEEIELSPSDASVRSMEATVFQWQPSNLWHHPLYFEDPGLERSGHSYEAWLQPFASVSRFGVQLVGLPYQMTIDPICKKRYSLGWYRPGECAPKQLGQIPWNTNAAINQAAVTTGAVFALP